MKQLLLSSPLYNLQRPFVEPSANPSYAVVAYVRNRLGKFVEQLRSELYPEHAHLPAHVTILPPRKLCGTEQQAIDSLKKGAAGFRPFDIELDGIETFAPTTPTVFIRVARAAHLFREMHDQFNIGPFNCEEIWQYIPHLTIVKMPTLAESQAALVTARDRWSKFVGDRTCRIEELTFVREGESNHWIDLATVKLTGK